MSGTIQEVTAAVERTLLRRGFVHEDPVAYRAGVRETTEALRLALHDLGLDDVGEAAAHGTTRRVA